MNNFFYSDLFTYELQYPLLKISKNWVLVYFFSPKFICIITYIPDMINCNIPTSFTNDIKQANFSKKHEIDGNISR